MVVEDLGQELIFISQCDLCGHGLTASLLSFYLKGMMEHYLSKFRFNLSTEDLLKGLSNTLDRLLFDTIGGGYFSTFFFGILDSAHSSLKYINGGHPPAILLNGEHKLSPIISNGPPLGFIKLKGQEIDVKELDFLPGEKLIICSDSLMELPLGSESEILGKEKYLEICQKGIETGQVNNAESLANLFLKATKNDGFNDDCSIFLVEYED